MGYVLQPGKKDQLVSDDYIIYSSKNCLDILRGLPTPAGARGATSISGTAKQFDVPAIILKHQKEKTKLDALNKKIHEIEFPSTSVNSLAEWFDKMDAYIDSLPEMNDEVTKVYEVEKRPEKDKKPEGWYYTGNVEAMDSEWNEHINNVKKKICEELNAKLQKVSKMMTDMLQSLANRLGVCGPFIKIISLVTKIPSLQDIIDWAKSIISFLFYIYELIFSVYKMAMQTLELIVVRFPQLMSKFISKMAKFNCGVNIKVQSIKINAGDKKVMDKTVETKTGTTDEGDGGSSPIRDAIKKEAPSMSLSDAQKYIFE